VLSLQKGQALISSAARRGLEAPPFSRAWRCRIPSGPSVANAKPVERDATSPISEPQHQIYPSPRLSEQADAQQIDPLYLFASFITWEQSEDPAAGWELIAAAESSDSATRASARALLAASRHLGGVGSGSISESAPGKKRIDTESDGMPTPYGLEIIENCTECTAQRPGFFCSFSHPLLEQFNEVSHKSTLPAGAILFVEGQPPRGMFILCSGRVNLSTTSREGKILILKSAMAGEALGLSATISGMGYEMTAEAATPCQLSFVDRKHFLELMESHTETGQHAAQCLSRDYRSAYRDIHDLILTRSSAGKLARLLLSHSPQELDCEDQIQTLMTHEEMAQRIGASRETVTRLLSRLRRKRLIRWDGPRLVIRDRSGLEALAV